MKNKMYSARVLACLAVLVGSAQSFSWDIVVGGEKTLKFYYDGTVTHKEDIPSAHTITAVTYDPVHFRVLFADYEYSNFSIHSFDITTRKMQTLVMRQSSVDIYASLAYDPVTQLLFWTEGFTMYSLLLKPASTNVAVDGNLIVTSDHYLVAIAVDSCGGYVNWATVYKIERAAFDGSEREVLINAHVNSRLSLTIDRQTEKMYWLEQATYTNQYTIKSADLNGKNRRTFYRTGSTDRAAALTVSKDFIYWRNFIQYNILRLPKHQQHDVALVLYSQSSTHCWDCPLIAANYTIEELTLGSKSCEALKSLIPHVEERHGSICHNYCFQGNCSVSAEGHPNCSCEAGYSGERCEVNACYMYCLNNGVCSVNEAGKPVCQCTAEYQGGICDVSICKEYCLHGNCSVSSEGQRTCSCDRGYSGERCDVSICKDYCFDGNCSVSTEGQPTCSCNRGYSGERCEVNACHKHCLNDGVCSLNEAEEPVCQCTADYEGERCDVSICNNYCVKGNCSVSTEGQRTCRCNAGYSGERCEVYACHEYCSNDGVCSLNEEEEPVCQCTADYEGERCHVAATHTGACVCADNMTQQILLEVKQVREDLQCTLQLYADKLDENAAKLQICEESRTDDQQNYDATMSKP